MTVLQQILSNNTIIIPSISWFVAQTIKVLIYLNKKKKFDISKFFSSGGMPSSHTSFVVSLAITIGKNSGFDSPVFGIAFVIALVVMYDAAGVRRAAGKQAQVLNKLIAQMQSGEMHIEATLKELIGHSPFEVFAGAILGTLFALLLN